MPEIKIRFITDTAATRPNDKDERNCRNAGIGMLVDVDDMLIREVCGDATKLPKNGRKTRLCFEAWGHSVLPRF